MVAFFFFVAWFWRRTFMVDLRWRAFGYGLSVWCVYGLFVVNFLRRAFGGDLLAVGLRRRTFRGRRNFGLTRPSNVNEDPGHFHNKRQARTQAFPGEGARSKRASMTQGLHYCIRHSRRVTITRVTEGRSLGTSDC